jgi:hypothetical protein
LVAGKIARVSLWSQKRWTAHQRSITAGSLTRLAAASSRGSSSPSGRTYDGTMVVEVFASGDRTRMVVTLEPMHDDEFTKMSTEGFTSQLAKLAPPFGRNVS